MVLFVLFEHASGYALFQCSGVEDIGAFLPQVQDAMSDFARFGQLVNLTAFSPFKTGANALDNVNSISEGLIHEDLQVFLEANLPSGKKAKKVVLGVSDGKLGGSIQEQLGIKCESGGSVLEVTRGIRLYFTKLVKGLTGPAAAKAQLGLGHSYSRAKVKFNVNRVDNMIIQGISLLDQVDKDINTFSMRIREWYSYHFPELVKIVPDNYMYARAANFIGARKNLTEEMRGGLEDIVQDAEKVAAVFDAAKVSMGMEISPVDLLNIEHFTVRVIALADYRRQLMDYLTSKMMDIAPNLTTLIGEQVGARLISHAGSLTNLAKYPASTVQILGAEKALFRALKTRGNTPKYGLIFHSSFIGRAGTKNKGRISRYLANKCSIAARIDSFSEQPTSTFGEKLKGQVEERLKFYETGVTPRKNVEVMREAIEEAKTVLGGMEVNGLGVAPSSEKKKKKKKKVKSEDMDDAIFVESTQDSQEEMDAEVVVESPKKKKKKHKKSVDAEV